MNQKMESGLRKIGDKEFNRLSVFIEKEVGIKLPPAKRSMMESRLQKRLKIHNIPTFGEYCDFVFNSDKGAVELIEMIDALTTNKTDFMRESAHFEYMVNSALPDLLQTRTEIKLWSAACSSGQEPYNMAMFMEEYKARNGNVNYSIVATDISQSSLQKARKAIYRKSDIDIVSEQFKKNYFLRSKDPDKDAVRIKPFIRNRVSFRPINLMKEEYNLNRQFDIIFCRNVLIYFNKENQSAVIGRLVNHLTNGGYLFLGHSESLAGLRRELVSVGASIYRKE